jgi:SNF2 family DNA or RNA helicase
MVTSSPAEVSAYRDTDTGLVAFNYGLIKRLARQGSWRRGYDYFKQSQVQDISLTKQGVAAKVKGKFKQFYDTKLTFTPDGLEPTCTCPLEEVWCKHAVAVALTVADQQLWEAYWGLPEPPHLPEPLTHHEGRYRFLLDWHKQPGKAIGIKVYDRQRNQGVRDTEATLKTLLMETSKRYTPIEKAEIAVLQALVKAGAKTTHDKAGWFILNHKYATDLMAQLARCEEVTDKLGNRYLFSTHPLTMQVGVAPFNAGQLMLSVHWCHPVTGDELPTSELAFAHPTVAWAKRDQTFYPLTPALSALPMAYQPNAFSDLSDADVGPFIIDTLPKLEAMGVLLDDPESINQLRPKKLEPKAGFSIEMVDIAAMRLRATLNFNYDKHKIPFNKVIPPTPYMVVLNKKKEPQGWVERDYDGERAILGRLLDAGMQHLQNNHFQVEGDAAVDFYNSILPQLEKSGWAVHRINPKEMMVLRASRETLKLVARIEFDEASVSHFTLNIGCRIGKQTMDMGEVQSHLLSGKKFFMVNGVGFVEIPLAPLLQFNRTLQAFEPENLDLDLYRIQTYKAGLLGEMIDQGVEMSFSRKFKKFWDVLTAGKSMEELKIPDSIHAELRPYQERGFHWLWFLYTYGLNGVLADDMGLGKTLQALVMLQQAHERHDSLPSLIVCPTTLVYNWMNEIRKFTPGLSVMNLTGSERFDRYQEIKNHDLVITSYAILRRDINALKDYEFRFVILDESQNIKNHESQTAMAAKQLQSRARLALSGTPIENRLSELWSLFDFLMPGFLDEYSEFRRRFIQPIEERGNRDMERRLKKQVFPFMLRRMKRDVLQDLPPKLEMLQYCDLTDDQYGLYMRILEKTRDELMEEAILKGGKPNQNAVFRALVRLRQVCNHPSLLGEELSEGIRHSGKFEALKDLLESAVDNGHRILVFSQFVEMLKLIKPWLEKKGYRYEMLTGQTKNRQEAVDRFNNDEGIPIFLVSLKAGGTGLNLTGADCVIHYDPWWNPAAEDQATDRVHRIGQTKKVFVYRLITRGTVEEKIMRLKDRKRDLVDSIIAADRTMGKKLSLDDLKDILSVDF